jgi:hypothetical protein
MVYLRLVDAGDYTHPISIVNMNCYVLFSGVIFFMILLSSLAALGCYAVFPMFHAFAGRVYMPVYSD